MAASVCCTHWHRRVAAPWQPGQHSKVAAQQGCSTAGSQHSRVAVQQGCSTAGSRHSKVAAQQGRSTAEGCCGSRVAAQQGRSSLSSAGSPVFLQPSKPRPAGGPCSRPGPAIQIFEKFRNMFLLFLSKSAFLFLGTRSCTPPSVPAGSQMRCSFNGRGGRIIKAKIKTRKEASTVRS